VTAVGLGQEESLKLRVGLYSYREILRLKLASTAYYALLLVKFSWTKGAYSMFSREAHHNSQETGHPFLKCVIHASSLSGDSVQKFPNCDYYRMVRIVEAASRAITLPRDSKLSYLMSMVY